jgi:hypothetical protein
MRELWQRRSEFAKFCAEHGNEGYQVLGRLTDIGQHLSRIYLSATVDGKTFIGSFGHFGVNQFGVWARRIIKRFSSCYTSTVTENSRKPVNMQPTLLLFWGLWKPSVHAGLRGGAIKTPASAIAAQVHSPSATLA